MKYKIKRVRYEDGTKSPWYKIEIYKNGRLFDELDTQYSSFWDAFKIWLIASL